MSSVTDKIIGAASTKVTSVVNDKVSQALSKVNSVSNFSALGSLDTFGNLTSLLSQTASSAALSKLASPLFGGGPEDQLAAPDIYAINSDSVINNTVDKLSGFDADSTLGTFRQSGGLLGSLSSLGKTALGGLTSLAGGANLTSLARGVTDGLGLGNVANLGSSLLSGGGMNTATLLNAIPILTTTRIDTNLSSLSSRVLGNVGGLGSLLGYSSDLKQSLLQGIATSVGGQFGVPPSIVNAGIAIINGQRTPFYSNNFTDSRATFNLVDRQTGPETQVQLIDVAAESSTMTTSMGQMIQLGVPDAVQALVDTASDPTVARTALQANIQTAVSASDMTTIHLLITQLGVGTIQSQMPDFATQLLSSYRIPTGTTTDAYPALMTDLVGVLNTVSPAWDTVNRHGEVLPNLAVFIQISDGARRVLSTAPTYATAIALAPTYPSVDLWNTLQTEYPYMVKL